VSLDSSFTRTHVLAKKGPVDGDGDGWVYDGTPKKRPATPAEQAAGARLRAGKKAAGPVAGKKAAAPRKAAAKKAPAKNDYDKRVDKFDRAINQAIRSGDKKQIKQVHDLIGQDFVLKKPDRDDLQNVLAARRDGLADPPPVKGSNRAVRMPKQAGEAPAPAKAPAKKAAAPRAAAKKVAEKKPEAPPAKKTTPPPAKKVDAAKRIEAHTGKPGLPPRAGQGDLQRRIAQSNAKKKMEEAAGKTIDSEKGVQELADAIIAAREAGVPDSELAPFRERLRAAADHVDRKAIKDRMSLERRAAKKVAAKKPSAPKPVETTHGLKTRAWMRHAEKDIKAARDFRTLKGRVTQINNALAAKRITEREANHLRKMVIDRLGELGLDRNGQRKDPTWKPGNPSWADRLKAKIKSPKKGPGTATRAKEQASFERKAMENAVFRVKQRIDDAKDMDSLAQLRGQLRADPVNKPLRDHLRANPSKLEAINDHFRQKRDQLAQAAAAEPKAKPETVVPKLPPGEARERAKANLPSEWADRLNAARNLSDLEGLMDRLEGDKSIPNDDFNKVAEALNEAMDREEDRANAFAAAGVEFDEPMDRDIRARLDTYFAKPKSNIANAPQEGLYQYMLVTPERFEFKQQNDRHHHRQGDGRAVVRQAQRVPQRLRQGDGRGGRAQSGGHQQARRARVQERGLRSLVQGGREVVPGHGHAHTGRLAGQRPRRRTEACRRHASRRHRQGGGREGAPAGRPAGPHRHGGLRLPHRQQGGPARRERVLPAQGQRDEGAVHRPRPRFRWVRRQPEAAGAVLRLVRHGLPRQPQGRVGHLPADR
jgi:histone H1/5